MLKMLKMLRQFFTFFGKFMGNLGIFANFQSIFPNCPKVSSNFEEFLGNFSKSPKLSPNTPVNFPEFPGQNRPGKFPKEMLALYT